MSTTTLLPQVKINAVLVRIEYGHFNKANCKFDKKAHIKVLKNNKPVDFFVQPLDEAHKIDMSYPKIKHEFESKDGTPTEPIWTTTYNGDYTDGDIWVPLDENEKSLKLRVKSGQFDGVCSLNLTEKPSNKDYDLYDEHGKKMDGCSLKLSFEFGTQYEIDFHTGDPHFTPGTGTDVQILDNISPTLGVLFADLYKKLKSFNPFHIGSHSSKKDDDSIVMFQISGTNGKSRFYHCKDGKQEEIHSPKTKRVSFSSKHRVFVPSSVGQPATISIRLVSIAETKRTWFLERLILKSIGTKTDELVMPCYNWITEGRMKTISMPYGFLPQMLRDTTQLRSLYQERLNELEVAKSNYQWDIQYVIPSFFRGTGYGAYDFLPLIEKFDDYKNKDFSYLVGKGLQNTIINALLSKTDKTYFDNIDDFHHLYKLNISKAVSKPFITADNWTDDAFFGWTYLAGTNPLHLTLCKSVPIQYKKLELKDSAGKIINLDDEIKKGRIYFVDYSGLAKYDLHTIGMRSDPALQIGRKYSAPCTCLFFVGDDKKLRPIAIQLIPDGEIYTPNDTKWQWMYAKMAVRNADAQYHQSVDHWMNAHAISETFSIALNRTVSRIHPVFRLVFPHLKYTIAINTLARRGLVSPGGFINQLFSIGEHFNALWTEGYSKLDFKSLDLPSRLAKQGFTRENKGALTDYPYMDDGLLVWDAIFEYVGEYLRLYYKSDDDVVNDIEINALIKELQLNGHPTRPYPDAKTINELQNILTTVMWTTSCHHSVVNFNQFQMYGFVPNYPPALFQPIPKSKDQINEAFVMNSLSGIKHACLLITLVNLLTAFAENEEYLTSERYMEFICEPKALECLNKFRQKLNSIENVIKNRNEDRLKKGFYEYKLLMPSHVPNSVAI